MKLYIIVGLVICLLLSGCPDIVEKTGEEKAVELVEETNKYGKLVATMSESMKKSGDCDIDEFIEKMGDYYSKMGAGEMPALSAEEKQTLRQQLEEFKACNISIDREVSQEEGNNYLVTYNYNVSPTCMGGGFSATENPLVFRADIGSGTTEVVGGDTSGMPDEIIEQFTEILVESGNCGFLVTTFAVGTVSTIQQPTT